MSSQLLKLRDWARKLDARLMALGTPARVGVLLFVLIFNIFVRLEALESFRSDLSWERPACRDYFADKYTARVVSNDWRDMYSKSQVEQTSQEQKLYSKEESSPYPPLALLGLGVLHQVGELTGIGFHGALITLELLTALLILGYCWSTRWYLMVLLYSNTHLAERVWWNGGASDPLVLFTLVTALCLVRARPALGQVLASLAVCIKVTPVFFLSSWFHFSQKVKIAAAALLSLSLLLPFFVLEGYVDIWMFHTMRNTRPVEKALSSLGWEALTPIASPLAWTLPLVITAAVILFLLNVQRELEWDWEDRIGWACVPFTLLFSMRNLTMRIMFFAMMVPDKRGTRSVFLAYLGLVDMIVVANGLRGDARHAVWCVFGFSGLLLIAAYLNALLKERRAKLARPL